ncbi:aminotransferase [Novosphingobium rosa]|uniref:aminotransferase n=1 Tax=Novosphingobium rosa TaxID=76978 RepID=UPI0008357233|nr:aminotransferase [Novosphingobium rosa]
MTQNTTIFERMSALCRNSDAVNLGQGFPDLPDPPELIEAARRALIDRSNQYPPMRGLAELRAAVCTYYAQTQGLSLDPAEVIVTSGATEALAATILALVEPGDEVICVQPLYDAYVPLIERAGGIPVFVDLKPPAWDLDIGALAEAITPRTAMILLNTPNNPTGTMLPRATLEAIGQLAEAYDLIVLCDEVWEGMIFDGTPHISPLAIPSLRQRSVKVGSAGKIFSLTGWKIGWAVAAPDLAERIAARHQFLTFTTPTPLQWAVADGLSLGRDWLSAHASRYFLGRRALIKGLGEAGYSLLPASATWFVTVDLAASGFTQTDAVVAERLVSEGGVGSIPVSAFYAQNPQTRYLRLCFCKMPETLTEAVDRLARFRAQRT